MLLKKIHRFIFGPQIGDVYQRKVSQYQNPFRVVDEPIVKIIDRREGWVQTCYIKSSDEYSHHTSDWNIVSFMRHWKLFDGKL